MAQQVKLRRSSVAGNKPTTAQLELGELAINTNDGKLYFEKSSSLGESVQEIIVTDAWNTGSINVSGSITVSGSINAASFTGSLLGTASYAAQALSSSYANNATSASYALNATSASYAATSTSASYAATSTSASYALVSTSASYAATSTSASYSNIATTASYALTSTSASYATTSSFAQNAQDILIYVKNVTGAQINKGTVVRISGATGDNALISTASYESDGVSANTLGITYQDIPNDNFGYIITEGTLIGINTNAFSAGQLLYLGATGSIIGTAPVAPLHAVRLGQVLRVQTNNGSMYVRIDNGYELGELHDVVDTTTTSSYGDLLVKSGSVWINSKQLTGPYSVTGSWSATSFTGSLSGTASYATQALSSSYASIAASASYIPTLQQVTSQGNTTTTAITSSGLYVSGSATISGNLNVLGTASFASVTSSVVIVGDSTIILNTDAPAVRFGGIEVIDSGSFGNNSTGSLLWDSEKNHWIYSNPSGSTYSGGMLISGPRNTGSIGDEQGTTLNAILKGQGGDHLTSSALIENGTSTNFYSNAAIITSAGSVTATSFTGSLLGTASYAANALSASYANNTTSASYALNTTSASYAFNATSASYALLAATASYYSGSLFAPGSTTQILYNNAGTVAGDSGLVYSGSRVGIGTVSPLYTLDVSGIARINGGLYNIGVASDTWAASSQEGLALKGGVSNGISTITTYLDDSSIRIGAGISQKTGILINGQTTGAGSSVLIRTGGATRLTINSTGAATFSAGVTATSFTGSLLGTASYATNALTASYYGGSIASASYAATASYVLNAVSASYSQNSTSASFTTNATSASYALTSSYVNTLNQNVLITGSATIGAASAGASENTLTLGARDTANEGGQLGFNAPGGTWTSASFLDNWSNQFRILRGNNTTSDGLVAQWNLHTKQMQLPAYTSATSFVGTATANLAVDSSGNVITVSTSGGTVFPYTGNAVITGSLTTTGVIYAQPNGGMYFQGGDDAALYDINVANTMGIYGMQTVTEGAIKLGSNGPTLYGSGSRLGIGTTTPTSASLTVSGNVWANSFTGSLLGTSSYAALAATASYAVLATTASYFSGSLSAPGSTTQILYNNGGTIAGDSGLVYSGSNVGIGITNPSTKLHVKVTTGTALTLSNTVTNLYAEMRFQSADSSAYIFKNSNGYGAYGGTNALNIFNEGQIAFHSSTASNIMYLTAAGNVGIGTTSPNGKLQVNQGTDLNVAINTVTNDATTVSRISSLNDAATLSMPLVINGNRLVLTTDGTEQMRITSGGNVGIGTTNPAAKLDIKGDLIVSSSLIANQNTASLGSGAQTISTNATSSYTAAFYNYTVASGSNARAGQVMAVWNGGSIQYTDSSTTDIGSTLAVVFTASLSNGNVQLKTVLPTSGWTVKTLANLI